MVLALTAVLAGQGVAEEIRAGCYQRIYSDQHLRDNPDQVVWQMRLKVGNGLAAGEREAVMEVIAANQGHARRDDNNGRVFTQGLICLDDAGTARCQVECDGGGFEVTRQDGDGLTFATDYLMVGEGDGCGGVMDLAEKVGVTVKYRLNRVGDAVCSGM
ncbi:hypothetical protein MAA8898_03694 [Maliponia aquimaris]|uniref:Uncharacterized protein n=2 Tax=Maliponia aquimaris TaxID=1673631 RepID=A0A238KXX8_9RHOB|nr:hypothetical protein MAA8898_03694 [Maliponia aquimaris]